MRVCIYARVASKDKIALDAQVEWLKYYAEEIGDDVIYIIEDILSFRLLLSGVQPRPASGTATPTADSSL